MMFCALAFADDMLAGLVARVKKLRTKLMVGDLYETEVVFVVIGLMSWYTRGVCGLLYWNERELTKRSGKMTLFVFDSIFLEAAQLSRQ